MSKRELAASLLGSRFTRQIWLATKAVNPGSQELRILAYHRVLDDDPDTFPFDVDLISATPEGFHRQMEFVRRNFNVISFQDLDRCEQEGRSWPSRALIVTFDDGYRDNYTQAFPILKSLGLPATIFLTVGHIGDAKLFWWDLLAYCIKYTGQQQLTIPEVSPQPIPIATVPERCDAIRTVSQWVKQVPEETKNLFLERLPLELEIALPDDIAKGMHLSWEEVKEMASSGIEFGGHTVTHPILTNVREAQLETEIVRTKSIMEQHLGKPVVAFAYPNGGRTSFNGKTQEAVARDGFRYAVSYGMPYGDEFARDKARYRYALPRISVEREHSFELFRANLMFPRLMSR